MPRSPRVRFCGAVSHVMSRGNERRAIYADDDDRTTFLRILRQALRRYNVICHAYCTMGNHYHLVLETPDANLSRAMQFLNGTYGQAYNRRHARVGHLFQGRFKEVLVERQSFLLELSRYVVLNPVRAGLVTLPHEWPWSSFRATVGLAPCPDFLCVEWLLQSFDEQDLLRARSRYMEFVLDGVGRTAGFAERLGQEPALGGEEFVSRFQLGLERAASPIREVTARNRLAGRPVLETLFDGSVGRSERDRLMHRAHERHGYTVSEIARCLGVHRTTASRAIRRAEMRQFTV